MKRVVRPEASAQIFLGVDSPFLRPGLEPDDEDPFEVRLVDFLRHGEHDDDAAAREQGVSILYRIKAAHRPAGGIADELVDALDIVAREARRLLSSPAPLFQRPG